jgi:hypothetical protein
MPPPDPDMSARQVARMYSDDAARIRAGALLIALGGALTMGFVAVISTQMKRMEGMRGPLSYMQLGTGAIGILFFTIPGFFWVTAAFRPLDDIAITSRLHDAGWLAFLIPIFPAMIQNMAIAIACFTDKRAQPVFPRWMGYFQIWIALLFLPSVLVPFFKTGPFAWNGIFTFWVAAAAIGIWMIVMVKYLLEAIRTQEDEESVVQTATREAVLA